MLDYKCIGPLLPLLAALTLILPFQVTHYVFVINYWLLRQLRPKKLLVLPIVLSHLNFVSSHNVF